MNRPWTIAVCPVLPYPPESGGRKRTLRILEAAERAGLDLHLLTTEVGEPGAVEALRGRGWNVEILAEPPGRLGERLEQQLRRRPSPFLPTVDARLRELVPSGPAAVLLEHTQSAYYFDALRGVPTILSLHNVDSKLMRSIAQAQRPATRAWLRAWNRWHTMRATERHGLPRADAVLCVSEGDAEALAPLSDDLIVAPNGVDDDFFEVAPEPRAEPRVFFFGRLDYPPNDHGIARFLREGWGMVLDSHPEARLRLAGAGGSDELQQLAAGTPGVEYVGFVDDLMEELSAASLTVVPLWAGGGTRLKVLESLAAARPVVGTSLGVEGLGFESERHGLVADSSAGMAAAVTRLLDDGELRARLARQGRELAERFRWPLALAPVEDLYRRFAASAEVSAGPPRDASGPRSCVSPDPPAGPDRRG